VKTIPLEQERFKQLLKEMHYGYVKGYLEDKKLEVRSAQIERLAKQIEGVKRSTGQHPGGIVVVPKNKDDF
jgi:DNA polymerase III subunit alpha, Gram-positive type